MTGEALTDFKTSCKPQPHLKIENITCYLFIFIHFSQVFIYAMYVYHVPTQNTHVGLLKGLRVCVHACMSLSKTDLDGRNKGIQSFGSLLCPFIWVSNQCTSTSSQRGDLRYTLVKGCFHDTGHSLIPNTCILKTTWPLH